MACQAGPAARRLSARVSVATPPTAIPNQSATAGHRSRQRKQSALITLNASPAAAGDVMAQTAASTSNRRSVICDSDAKASGVPGKVNEPRSEEHTSELQSLMRTSYAVFCLKKT